MFMFTLSLACADLQPLLWSGPMAPTCSPKRSCLPCASPLLATPSRQPVARRRCSSHLPPAGCRLCAASDLQPWTSCAPPPLTSNGWPPASSPIEAPSWLRQFPAHAGMVSEACESWRLQPAPLFRIAQRLRTTRTRGTNFSCADLCKFSLARSRGPALVVCSRVAVPEFDPASAAGVKSNAALLVAAEAHLGNSLAQLYVAMPTLAACGFKASFLKQPAEMFSQSVTTRAWKGAQGSGDAASIAVAAVGPGMGVDMAALRSLVASARAALAQASR